jgi:hypothetical protein
VTVRCHGVHRDLGEGAAGACSLGRHCDARSLLSDPDAYRDAHPRTSETPHLFDPVPGAGTGSAAAASATSEALLDVINVAMDRLAAINPPEPPRDGTGPRGRVSDERG